MNKSRYWSISLQNIIIGMGWIYLAIHFNMWWIALFSLACFIFMEPRQDSGKDGAENEV